MKSEIRTVHDFVKLVMTWTYKSQRPIAFRGQAYRDWSTEPKLFRTSVGMYNHEKKSVRDLVSIHPQEFKDDETMFDRLVRMQHYQLPTRLLDVTTNPLVALFFATDEHLNEGIPKDGKVQAFFVAEDRQRYYDSDRVSLVANLANLTPSEKKELNTAITLSRAEFNQTDVAKRHVWFVRLEKPHFEATIDPTDLEWPVFVKPKLSNRRIIAQSGAFMIYGSRTVAEDEGLELRRITIPASAKAVIREQLELLGVHAGNLFPEIDKAAEYVVRRYTKRQ